MNNMVNSLLINNCIVKECLTVGINNSNTIIGYKLAFIRSRFGINVIDTRYDVCLHNVASIRC